VINFIVKVKDHYINIMPAVAVVPVPYPQWCLFLVPWHLNKFFYFYIVGNGFSMGERGSGGGMKTP